MDSATAGAMEWVDRLDEIRAYEAVWASFMKFSGRFGFDTGAMADLPAPHENLRATTLSWSWREEWRNRYLAREYVNIDPTVRALQHTTNPYSWKEALCFAEYGVSERRIFDEAGDFGMKDGLVIPITGIRTGTALITITGPATDLSPVERRALYLVAVSAHRRICDLLPGRKSYCVITLSPRECECLKWAAIGKSDSDIAEILSISARTAKAHIDNAARKYQVNTRVQAVVRALRDRAIFI